MTKKKKPKKSKSGKTSSASAASSSTQSSGVNKQLSFQIPADLSPVNLDLVAAVEAGSVTVSGPVNLDLVAAAEAGSVTVPPPVNLDLEASVEAGSVVVSVPDLPFQPTEKSVNTLEVAGNAANPETTAPAPQATSPPETNNANTTIEKQKESKATFPGKSVHPQQNHAASIPPLRSSSSGNPQGNLEASCKGKCVAVSTNTRHTAAGFSDPSRISLKGIHIEQPESSNVNVTTSVSEVESDSPDVPS
ncbi:hypothetical protein F2Q70_00019642 [Brassica cretica]|uniref:Uncharacterized protein n=1 Tax=Brassica cretica TaxID=69181 RepID=A0A8S9GZP4_BRACR|nr:hypothetical protein F2Q70_00019642 [Brassica cretica]